MRNFCPSALGAALGLLLIVRFAAAQVPIQSPSSQRREVAVATNQMEQIRAQLHAVLANRARFDPANPARMELQTDSGLVVIEFRPNEQRLLIEGAPRLTSEIARLVTWLTQPAEVGTLRAMPLNDKGQASLTQSALLATGIQTGASPFGLPSFSATGPNRSIPGRLTAAQQEGAVPTAGGQAGAGQLNQPPTEQTADQPPLPLQPFEGVQVEMLPEIDAIILRGRDQQLQDLAEIIKRLDEASQQAQPIVEIIQLQYTSADSVSALITQTQTGLLSTRQGRASVTPLSKPNALLVIGWGDALNVVKELIGKLDVPVQGDTQFAIRQLRYARATEVQTQLRSFFQSRGQLSPTIQSTIDSRTNAIIIHASPRDLQEIQALLDQLDVPRGEAMQQARVFEIQHSLAADVAQTLQTALAASAAGNQISLQLVDQDGRPLATSGVLGTSQITVNDRNNTLIVSTAPENLELIQRLIEQLDTPGMVAKIKIFPIHNGDAGDMVQMLRSLIPSQAPGTNGSPQLSSAPNESSLVPLRFTVDGRGNNIIAVGSEGDLSIVEALVIRLDESDTMQRKSTVYQLKNSPAVDVALAVNEFLRSKRTVENAAPLSSNPFAQLEKEVVVVPEPVQNKLILSATPRYYEEVSRLIEQLDQQPPQVMIQVLIAEITLGDTDEFGVELGLQNSVLFDRSLLGDLLTRTSTTNTSTPAGVVTSTTQDILAASNLPGLNFNNTLPLGNSGSAQALNGAGQVGGQGISNFAVGRNNDTAGFGGLVLSASSENVSFLLRALQESRRLEILSRPQILTLDNQQAFIQVGQRVPRIVNSIINQNGAQNNVALENVGLIIGVTPRISPENNVVMEIDAEKSKLGPENEGIPVSISSNGTVIRSPRIDTITAQATVSAANGETIILGGLISRSTQTLHRQVPFLGDLPVLKHLFSYDLFDMKRTELLIIMTPHVVRSQGDMEQLKQAEFARMSWCEADVFAIHGDVYPTTNLTTQLTDSMDCNVVYPDIDPRGVTEGTVDEALPYSTAPQIPANSPVPSARPEVVPTPSGQSGGVVPIRSTSPLATLDLPTVPALSAATSGATAVVTASASSPVAATNNTIGVAGGTAARLSPPASQPQTFGGMR
jgi:general secretion pathway protein D